MVPIGERALRRALGETVRLKLYPDALWEKEAKEGRLEFDHSTGRFYVCDSEARLRYDLGNPPAGRAYIMRFPRRNKEVWYAVHL